MLLYRLEMEVTLISIMAVRLEGKWLVSCFRVYNVLSALITSCDPATVKNK